VLVLGVGPREVQLGLDDLSHLLRHGQIRLQRSRSVLRVVVVGLGRRTEPRLEANEPRASLVEGIEVGREAFRAAELLSDDRLRRLPPLVALSPEQPADRGVAHGDPVCLAEPGRDLTVALPLS